MMELLCVLMIQMQPGNGSICVKPDGNVIIENLTPDSASREFWNNAGISLAEACKIGKDFQNEKLGR